MRIKVLFLSLLLMISSISLYGQTLTADQQHELALIQRDQSIVQYNDQLFAALMRSVLARYTQPSWAHVNMLLWTSFDQIAAEALIDYSVGSFSLFGGWQVYLLDYQAEIPGLSRYEQNTEAVAMNIPLGINIYSQELGQLAAGMRFVIGDTPLSDSEMVDKARGDYSSSSDVMRSFRPYIFYDGPLNKYLDYRLDGTFDMSNKNLSRYGTDILGKLGGLYFGPSYDKLDKSSGDQTNLALSLYLALGGSKSTIFSDTSPKAGLKWGRLKESSSSGSKKTTYYTIEYNQNLQAGLSLKSGSGLGFKLGYNTGWEDGNGRVNMSMLLMSDYPCDTMYGPVSDDTVFSFYMSRMFN